MRLSGKDTNTTVVEGNVSVDPFYFELESGPAARIVVITEGTKADILVQGALMDQIRGLEKGWRVRARGRLINHTQKKDEKFVLQIQAQSLVIEAPKKFFKVGRKEVHTQFYLVKAASPEHAKEIISQQDCDGIELEMVYDHTLETKHWTVEEPNEDERRHYREGH